MKKAKRNEQLPFKPYLHENNLLQNVSGINKQTSRMW